MPPSDARHRTCAVSKVTPRHFDVCSRSEKGIVAAVSGTIAASRSMAGRREPQISRSATCMFQKRAAIALLCAFAFFWIWHTQSPMHDGIPLPDGLPGDHALALQVAQRCDERCKIGEKEIVGLAKKAQLVLTVVQHESYCAGHKDGQLREQD